MTALLLAIVSLSNILCFVIGAKVGQTIIKGEKVNTPNLNPFKAYRENQSRKEVEKQQDKLSTVLRNIERYDGTSKGQEDVN
jgi:hypothetical protein